MLFWFRKRKGKPPLVDDVVGTLQWNDNANQYLGDLNVGGNSIGISLLPSEGTDVSAALVRARQVLQRFEHYRSLAAVYAVEELLDLKNDSWLEEDEAPLSPEDFRSRMSLEQITFAPDGGVDFWHNDGDLFWGHSIQFCIDADDRCVHADIPG